jgi:hypothetical protein
MLKVARELNTSASGLALMMLDALFIRSDDD